MSPMTRMKRHTKESVEGSKGEVRLDPFDLDNVNIDKQITSEERYWYYIEHGIPISEIHDIEREVIRSIEGYIPSKYLEGIKLKKAVASLESEVTESYRVAARKAILDYILLDEAERTRLGIRGPQLAFVPAISRGPVPWHDSYAAAKKEIDKTMWLTNPMMVRVLEISKKYEIVPAFDFSFLEKSIPISLEDFMATVKSQIADYKEMLLKQWIQGICECFLQNRDDWYCIVTRNSDKEHAYKELDSFFASVATLMSNQLWRMADYNISILEKLFAEYEEATSAHSLFKIHLDVFANRLRFSPSLSEMENTLVTVVEEFLAALQHLPRIETKIFTSLKDSSLCLTPMTMESDRINNCQFIKTIFGKNSVHVQQHSLEYDKFKIILSQSYDKKMDEFLETPKTLAEYEQEILKLKEIIDKIDEQPNKVWLSMFFVDCEELNTQLRDRTRGLIQRILDLVSDENRKTNTKISEKFEAISSNAMKIPSETKELVELTRYLDNVRQNELVTLQKDLVDSKRRLEFLIDYAIMSDEDMKLNAGAFTWTSRILPILELSKKRIMQKKIKAQEDLKSKIEVVSKLIDGLHEQVLKFKDFSITTDAAEYVTRIQQVEVELATASESIKELNVEEELLEWEKSEFPKYQEAKVVLEPFKKLWETTALFLVEHSKWMTGPFVNLEYQRVEELSGDLWREIIKLGKTFADQHVPRKVTETVKTKLEKFKTFLPIISALRSEGLRERHWNEINAIVGSSVAPTPETTLAQLIELDLGQHLAAIEGIAETAAKEFGLLRTLQKMQNDWTNVSLTCLNYKDTGTKIVSSVDDIQSLLDDQIVKVQTMRGSPFAKAIEADVVSWETVLTLIQDILDAMLTFQATWLYLEPIFSSEDIMSQMPVEGKKFNSVDGTWREIMASISEDSHVLRVSGIPSILQRLKDSNLLLEEIQKGLNEYLEKKRLFFPRFFFLSNDELLEILAETKDPMRVQPHLKKCFEGIAKLQFDSHTKITGMCSSEDEKVKLAETIDPAAAKGAVERWLLQVEKVMQSSVYYQIKEALQAYGSSNRENWVLEWPGQVVLCVSQIFWTKEVTEAINSGRKDALAKYRDTCTKQLEDIVALVRGKLTPMARLTLSALVVIDVHARDTVAELVKQNLKSEDDFEWTSQLRYYWENDNVYVRMINATLKYGFEYLGNSPRLVITSLTDRCYRTLIGALDLNLGGAPEGPAGTGKTESVKDLAKAIAKQCVVFNCSDGLDYIAMGKFFKGLASSGAWACFDEFNRIDLEVLSVVAQQILTIQRAVAAKMEKFVFEGTTIALNRECSVFITMNPGYAGRSELPDNLKALFRPVAMMVPDYALIAEISLYSYGYVEARSLARKIVATYRLCSEQLSSQDHYDYGMRAVKAVLIAAGNMKIKYPNDDENTIMLRSIIDVNLPKFLDQDVPLFRAITSDLFPGVTVPVLDYTEFNKHVIANIEKMNLVAVPSFMEKIVQTYEMMCIRHGYMIVGLPWSGKTMVYKVLAAALRDMCDAGMNEKKVEYRVLNPKSITMGQLYGQFDPVTHEWSDGVLANTFRAFASQGTSERRWIIFDGPVDAIWIENMNTVLDDNKKLCLTSGEIMQMTSTMTTQFEVMDLAVASPATVSRCGMIYMEPDSLGWKPLVQSWLNTVQPMQAPEEHTYLTKMIGWLVPALVSIVKRCTGYVKVQPQSAVNSMLKMMFAYINDGTTCKSKSGIFASLQFSCVWSFGGYLDGNGRARFDEEFRSVLGGADSHNPRPSVSTFEPMFPANGGGSSGKTVFDFYFEATETRAQFRPWLDIVPKVQFAATAKLNEILVPTVDTVRVNYLLDLLVKNSYHTCLVGPTGTGKSVYVNDKLLRGLAKDKFVPSFINFSAQTSANQTQNLILSRLDKRRKGVYGPKLGQQAVIFVDDLNMPAPEKYGAQPPIELIRQWMDHQTWYDLKDMSPMTILDVTFITAMQPPGGGRNNISPRLLRHFNVLSVLDFDQATMKQIYESILEWHFSTRNFGDLVTTFRRELVQATLEVFQSSKKNLLPTPNKSHYLFNLRDFSRVIQGLVLTTPEKFQTRDKVARLWVHEAFRVFGDRLVDESDTQWLFGEVTRVLQSVMDMDIGSVCSRLKKSHGGAKLDKDDIRSLMFGRFGTASYDEMEDFEKLTDFVKSRLEEFNLLSKSPMDLVIFRFAVEHLVRICRILEQPGGHALLVGVGGSGRQSLSKLATHIVEYNLCQIEMTKSYGINEWREDLKKFLLKSGADGKPCVFLLSDTQIKSEVFLEDVNNLLNTGEVPNIFAQDEKVVICEKMRTLLLQDNPKAEFDQETLYAHFVNRCKGYLHIILCMSPIGETFRNRMRMFPSLINCCTIDWFHVWPEDALTMVALKFLESLSFSETLRESLVSICKDFHVSVRELSEEFYKGERRRNYVTPTSYLELIQTFKELLTKKQKEVEALQKRYESGLNQLASAAEQVGKMQEELNALQPQLIVTQKETNDMLVVIEEETAKAEVTRAAVKQDEAVANKKASEAKAIKDECEADLSEAIPALNSALEALDTLKPNDITLVKSMKNPPNAVKLVMEAICIMKGIKPSRVKDPGSGKMVDDFWGPAQKLLSDSHFLQSLKEYDKDNIDPKIIDKIRKTYTSNPEFVPDIVKNSSSAAEGLCKWVCALDKYDVVAKVVAPKKEALANAEAELSTEMGKLKIKQDELQVVEDKIAALEAQFAEMTAKKEQLEYTIDQCAKKLVRAEKLLGGLGGEKERWTLTAKNLEERYTNLTGDILLSAGVIAYLGAFTASYRQRIIQKWIDRCAQAHVPSSQVFNLTSILGDPIQIRNWILQGLPNDSFSLDNAIIANKTRRWPLFIDPQGQANKWIKNIEKPNKLAIIKLSDANYARTLENALQFGTPVLIENIGEELDSLLEPVLMKQTFKQGGSLCIRLGDAVVEYSPSFRLYITTKLRNPHYLPELSTKVTITNFMITSEGLEDQLLGIVVSKERPDLEDEKNKLVVASAENKKQLKEIEDKILDILFKSQGNLLDDESAIVALTDSKKLSEEIDAKQKIAEETERQIDAARALYKPIAMHSSVLFFVTADMANIEPMYQYSLAWFIGLFVQSIANSEKSDNVETRVANLKDFFTYSLYSNICRSLFKKDKTIFSFLLCTSLMKFRGEIKADEWHFFLTTGLIDVDIGPNPAPQWLPDKVWATIGRATALAEFKDLPASIRENLPAWKAIYESADPLEHQLPGDYENSLSEFKKLLVRRIVRFDKLNQAMMRFVGNCLGNRYLEPPPFDLASSFKDSTAITPLIFILSPGTDVMTSLIKFGETKEITAAKLQSISLGQGQGPIATQMIKNGMKTGQWIVLQNCHLATSWLPSLERLCEEFNPYTINKDFRLWLTSYPSPQFPISILENGVKITNEPPAGIRANLMRSYLTDPISDASFFSGVDATTEPAWKKMLFGLCFFHALVQERRLFGPIGWNIPYEFNESDLRISVKQLHKMLNETKVIPWKALQYLTGECNYGGRVTDDRDRRALAAILSLCYSPDILRIGYKLSESGKYVVPPIGDYDSYLAFIKTLPQTQTPEVFGLHSNADIMREIAESNHLVDAVTSTQSRMDTSTAGRSQDEILTEIAETTLKRLPPLFDLEKVQEKYALKYEESMNTVLIQELVRFNNLLSVIRDSLTQSIKALKGLVVMSKDLEEVCRNLMLGKVPEKWMSKSYPSLKPLGSYVNDFLERMRFFDEWINDKMPVVFWISGFYFTQSFITGTLQNYARKYNIPIDLLVIDCKVLNDEMPKASPADGVYVHGMFIEGARWDRDERALEDQYPKQLFDKMPVIHILPVKLEDVPQSEERYECPVYKTAVRRGVLSTTGHSTNFVMTLKLPSQRPVRHWIVRGTALLLQLSD